MLRAKGWTYQQIAAELGVNEKTIRRDMKTVDVKDFIDELIRQQLADIIESEGEIRLKYRDKLLDKLLPRKVEAKTESKGEMTFELKAWRPEKVDEDEVS